MWAYHRHLIMSCQFKYQLWVDEDWCGYGCLRRIIFIRDLFLFYEKITLYHPKSHPWLHFAYKLFECMFCNINYNFCYTLYHNIKFIVKLNRKVWYATWKGLISLILNFLKKLYFTVLNYTLIILYTLNFEILSKIIANLMLECKL